MAHRTVAVLAIAAALAARAGADGRTPLTTRVATDGQTVIAGTTFGALISRDGGCSFRWVCDEALGSDGGFEPEYAAAADGTLFATTYKGLRVSRDGGCTWETATEAQPRRARGRIAGIWIDAIDIAPNGDVWVATADSALPNDVFRSTDGGRTFEPRNRRSPTIWWKSVKVAPSRARRVYVTGYQVAQPPRTYLFSSDDAGATWTESPLAGVAFAMPPIVYVLAVDPVNPDIVFVTSPRANRPGGDRLYRSTDAGATLSDVLATSSRIRGVVHHGGAVVVATAGGAYRSTDGGATFTALPAAPQLNCLAAHGDALIGCAANWEPDHKALARSTDGGATWSRLVQFVNLGGPLACGPGTGVARLCTPRWPALQQQFGAPGGANAACPVEPPPKIPPPPAPKSGGCCDAGGSPLGAAALLLWLGLLLARRAARP